MMRNSTYFYLVLIKSTVLAAYPEKSEAEKHIKSESINNSCDLFGNKVIYKIQAIKIEPKFIEADWI